MRTDARIDKKQVCCAKSPHLQTGKFHCQVGDLFLYIESERMVLGRMLGRIAYAPAIGETPTIRGAILAIVINSELSFTYERWVNPLDVVRIFSIDRQKDVMAYFLGPEMLSAKIDEIRAVAGEWSTLAAYRQYMTKREADMTFANDYRLTLEDSQRIKCAECGNPATTGQNNGSAPFWYHCDECAQRAKDWPGLLNRSFDRLLRDHPDMPREFARAELERIHRMFRGAR